MKLKQPEMVEAVLDILDRLPGTSDRDANLFFSRLRAHGVKHLRTFLWNVWGEQKPHSQMFHKRASGKFQIFKVSGDMTSGIRWNPKYWKEFERLVKLSTNWRIAQYVDFGDHCSTRKTMRDKHPLYNNIDGIDGMYDTSEKAQVMWDAIIRKVVEIVGTDNIRVPTLIPGITRRGPKPWYGLGNELYCKEGKPEHHFGEFWAYPKALLLRELGYDEPIMFSASHGAAHAIRAYVSTEGGWHTIFKPRDTVRVIHGVDLYEDFEEILKGIKAGRGFAISDDGTNCKDIYRKAICVNVDRYCSADKASVIRLVKNIWLYMKTIGHKKCYFHHIEMLGRSVSESYQSLRNINHKRDLNVFTSVSEAVFNKNIQWKIPRWARRRFLRKPKKNNS